MNKEKILSELQRLHSEEGILFTGEEDAESYFRNLTNLIESFVKRAQICKELIPTGTAHGDTFCGRENICEIHHNLALGSSE